MPQARTAIQEELMRPWVLLLAAFLTYTALSRVVKTRRASGPFPFPTRASHGRIDLRAEGSISRWCASLGCTEPQLRRAISAVGHSAEAVRQHLMQPA
jgi:hypothetical protein